MRYQGEAGIRPIGHSSPPVVTTKKSIPSLPSWDIGTTEGSRDLERNISYPRIYFSHIFAHGMVKEWGDQESRGPRSTRIRQLCGAFRVDNLFDVKPHITLWIEKTLSISMQLVLSLASKSIHLTYSKALNILLEILLLALGTSDKNRNSVYTRLAFSLVPFWAVQRNPEWAHRRTIRRSVNL